METCCSSRPSFPRKSESPAKATSLFINPSGTTGKIAIAVRHVVLVLELETLGVYDETGSEPTPIPIARCWNGRAMGT